MRIFIIVVVLVLVSLVVGRYIGTLDADIQQAVYHIDYDDSQRQQRALRNMQNHIDAMAGSTLDLIVVLNGRGVSLLQTNADSLHLHDTIRHLRQQGTEFKICNNTLQAGNIDYRTLFDVDIDDIVTSGVVELAQLQNHGYAYIKP